MFRYLRCFFLFSVLAFLAACTDDANSTGKHAESCFEDGTCQHGLVCDPATGLCILAGEGCGARVCGLSPDAGYDCGTCLGESELCMDNGQCADDCLGLECGPSPGLGVDCGTCTGPDQVCSEAGQCEDDCAGVECGPSPRLTVDCGACSGQTELCSEAGQCIDDCAEVECGSSPSGGFDCGTCFGATYVCTDAGECVDDCDAVECGLSPNLGHDCGNCPGSGSICDNAGQCIQGWDPRFDDFAQSLQQDLAMSKAYGVSAAVMENGVVTFAQAFGSKDSYGAVQLTPDTLMQIGSTTKQMTAVALLRNVEVGQVSLSDSLEQVLPLLEFALDGSWDDQVTLQHLLTHQGAFNDSLLWANPADSQLADYTYATFDDESFLMNPPGVFWNYSNPNFVLAGLISEALDVRAWPDIMKEDVFVPLGMNRTFLRKTEVEADGDYALSYGYGVDDLPNGYQGHVEMDMVPDPGWSRPAGFVWTTPTQMLTWAKFLMDGNPTVLGETLRLAINSEQVDTLHPVGSTFYGYGQFVHRGHLTEDGKWHETPVWEHGGNTWSFTNIFYVLPEHDFAVAICISGYGVNFFSSVDTAIMTLVELPAPTPAPEHPFVPSRLDDRVGTYLDEFNVGAMIITRDGDSLSIQMPDLVALGYDVQPALAAVTSEYFYVFIDGYPYDLTFIPLGGGGRSHFVRNRMFVTTRVPDGVIGGRPTLTKANVERMLIRARLEPIPMRPIPPIP